MSYRISILNGKPVVEADNADEAHAFVKRMSLTTQPVPRGPYKTTKKTTHKSHRKTYLPWLEQEIRTVLNHLNENTHVITRYVPNHTPLATAAFVYKLRRGEKQGTATQAIIDRIKNS